MSPGLYLFLIWSLAVSGSPDDHKIFLFEGSRYTFVHVKSQCRFSGNPGMLGGQLCGQESPAGVEDYPLHLDNQRELDMLASVIQDNGWTDNMYWTGLGKRSADASFKSYGSGWGSSFIPWAPNQPSGSASGGCACAALQKMDGAWGLVEHGCDQMAYVICESNKVHLHEGHLYTIITHPAVTTVPDAGTHCTARNFGHPVVIETYAEQKNLEMALTSDYYANEGTRRPLLIGMKGTMKGWLWWDDSYVSYKNFKEGEENAYMHSASPYVAIDNMENYTWVAVPYTDAGMPTMFGYICETDTYQKIFTAEELMGRMEHEKDCNTAKEDSVYQHAGYLYYFGRDDDIVDCLEADAKCRNMGFTSLATVHNQQEMDFIESVIQGYYHAGRWIGLHASGMKHAQLLYSWRDGTYSSYNNWAEGQPLHFSTTADDTCMCAAIHPVTNSYTAEPWMAKKCGTRLPYICKKEMDECCQHPCQNGGHCFNTEGSYICACPDGLHGKNCTEYVDEENVEELGAKSSCFAEEGIHGTCEDHGGLMSLIYKGESWNLGNDAFQASSFTEGHEPRKIVMTGCSDTSSCGSWAPVQGGDEYAGHLITIDLAEPVLVEHVLTQGKLFGDIDGEPMLALKPEVSYYSANFSLDGLSWKQYKPGALGYPINQAWDSKMHQKLVPPVYARYVRMQVTRYVDGTAIGMELLGCRVSGCAGQNQLANLVDQSSTTDSTTEFFTDWDDALLRSGAVMTRMLPGLMLLAVLLRVMVNMV